MEKEDYYLGIFLLGAYQDTLGDFHNLLGCAHEVHVMADGDDWYICQKEEGDTCLKLLDFFNYETKDSSGRSWDAAWSSICASLRKSRSRSKHGSTGR
jgi:arginine decarboxylase-like protein